MLAETREIVGAETRNRKEQQYRENCKEELNQLVTERRLEWEQERGQKGRRQAGAEESESRDGGQQGREEEQKQEAGS